MIQSTWRVQDAYDYRGDEEMDVYDQCCDNCANTHCPMLSIDDYMELTSMKKKEAKQARKRDCVRKNGHVCWCIYWKGGQKPAYCYDQYIDDEGMEEQ